MNLLAFDTGTERMSVAVTRTVDGRARLWQLDAAGGAKASTDLIPTILDLLAQAGLRLEQLDALCFGAGPGSFTGLRTACSVAQGLALGAGVPVLAMDSLLTVAEEARFSSLASQHAGVVTALLDARMNEIYAATYVFEGTQWTAIGDSSLVRPEALMDYLQSQQAGAQRLAPLLPWTLAGNVFTVYRDTLALHGVSGFVVCDTALPRATALLRLAPQWLADGRAVDAEHAVPRYIRDKVAQTTQERAAEKARLALMPGA